MSEIKRIFSLLLVLCLMLAAFGPAHAESAPKEQPVTYQTTQLSSKAAPSDSGASNGTASARTIDPSTFGMWMLTALVFGALLLILLAKHRDDKREQDEKNGKGRGGSS